MNAEHPALELTEVREPGRVRVRLQGELDLAGAPVLAETLRRLRARREPVLLDLDELVFIDMSGLRVVLAAAGDASTEAQAFMATRGSRQVRRLVALVGLEERLPFEGPA